MQIGNYDVEYIHNCNDTTETNNANQKIKGNIPEIKEKNSADLTEGRYINNNNKNESFEINQSIHDPSDEVYESLPCELLYILSQLQEEKKNSLCKNISISFVHDEFTIQNENHSPNNYSDPGPNNHSGVEYLGTNNHPGVEYLGMDNHPGVDKFGMNLNLNVGGADLREEEAIGEENEKNKVIDYLGRDNQPVVEKLNIDLQSPKSEISEIFYSKLDDILIQETIAKDCRNNDDIRNNDVMKGIYIYVFIYI
jgi:hypothetical protein